MTARCSAPVPWESLVAYWAGELGPNDASAVEEHVFACDACARQAESLASIVTALRRMIPPVVTAEQVAELRAAGARIVEAEFRAGETKQATFRPGVDLLIHRLGGLLLQDAERVHVTVRVDGGGPILTEEPYAPFDRERGEVLIACQRHFASLPPDVAFDVRVHAEGGSITASTFVVPHVFVD